MGRGGDSARRIAEAIVQMTGKEAFRMLDLLQQANPPLHSTVREYMRRLAEASRSSGKNLPPLR